MEIVGEVVEPAKKRRGGMSAEGRARVAAAQKARWLNVHAAEAVSPKVEAAAPKAKKKKRTISPAHRALIAAAQRARWARCSKQKGK